MPPERGYAPTMHSEWPAEHDTPPAAPAPPVWASPTSGPDGVEPGDGVVAAADAPPVVVSVTETDNDASAGTDTSGDVDVDGAGAEEDLHRSAVDAVDALLDEVELALARLDDGTYGRCEECGSPIDDDRLAELPIVRTCGRCVEGDGGTAHGGTPATDPAAISV